MQKTMINRLHHLDFLRASMMFLGVLVHASHADYDLGDYDLIRFVSGSFRMPCFFIIAGYFSLLVMNKTPLSSFFQKRLVMLGIPALTCVLILVPMTVSWMTVYFSEGGSDTTPHSGWMGHAWFLFVLIVYTLLLRPLQYGVEATVGLLSSRLGEYKSQILFFLLLVLAVMFVGKVVQKFGPLLPYYPEWKFLVSAIIGNLPHFILGMMMYKWSNVYAFLHGRMWLWISFAFLAVFAKYQLSQDEITSTMQHLIYMMVSYIAAYTASAALFSVSSRLLTRHNPLIRLFSESAYTVYIVHYIIIAAALVAMQRAGVDLLPRMLSAFVLASIVGVLIHIFLVKKVSLFAFLLNGRRLSSTVA